MPTWRLDELAHAGQEHLDAAYVAGYEAKAGYDPADDLAVLRRHGLGAESTVIDFGAGTGRFLLPRRPSRGRLPYPAGKTTSRSRRARGFTNSDGDLGKQFRPEC